jgi:uncharacterized protein (DUF2147 family)
MNRIAVNRTSVAVVIATLILGIDAAAAADPHGVWLRQSGSSKIRIDDCAGALCGTVVWEKAPRKDVNNPDAARRDDPITGRRVLLGMKPSGKPDQWKGEVYNAEDGKTYTGFITLKADGTLALEGCVLGGLICKTDVWSRSR